MVYRTPGARHFGGGPNGNFAGIARLGNLGVGQQALPSGLVVDYGAFSNGSGLTIHLGDDRKGRFDDSYIHELAHYLMGGNHPYTDCENPPYYCDNVDDNGRSGYWGIFGGSQATNSVNAYEQELLGWITPTELTSTTTFTLSDFVTTGASYKYTISPTEFYYFENRQKVQSTTGIDDTYDQPNWNDNDKGLFVLHVKENSSGNYLYWSDNSLESIVSDGNWDWEIDGWSVACGSDPATDLEPVFEKSTPNQFGESFKDPLLSVTKPTGGASYKQSLFIKPKNTAICTRYYLGFDSDDKSGFTETERSLITPYTNPAFLSRSKSQVGIGLKVTGKTGNTLSFKFYDDTFDPYTITENTTWDGQIFLDQNTKVENNATLTILPGTTVYMAENVHLDIRAGQGGTLISEGTEQDPIRFLRTDTTKAWKTIYLNSSAGNSIKWTLFDGGETNLTITSQNNVIENSTFRNATYRNIDSWHNNDGSGNSSATLSHVLIEDGATVGLVAQYTDLDISHTTIQDNAQAGILVTSASVYPFHRNKVTNNGSSYHDGVAVTSSGTFYMHDDNLEDGYNEVLGNAGDQVSGSGDIAVGFSYPLSDGGYNSVHGDFSGGKYLVNNTSSTTVMAERVWWGQSFPQPSMFNGPVQFDMFFLYNDPTIGQNPGTGGQTPAKALPGKEGEVLPLAEAYDQLERDLEKAETEQQVRDGLHQLYQVAWLAKKEAPELAGRFRELALQSASGNYPLFESARHNKTMQHAATLLYAKSYLRDGEYERAAGWLKDTDGTTLQAADRRDWLHIEMDLLRRSGEYEQALGKLEELYAYEQSRGVDIDMLKGDYQPIEQDLAIRMGGDQNVRDRLKQPIVSTSDQELVLENYPNPFNPTTQIRFTLPEQSQVSLVVYDMLGREVVRLVDEVLPAGEQTVRFDASNLANGVYIYRIQAIQQERVRMMTLIK